MQIEEREQIREKRSSLFSGRKKGRTILRKEVLIGAAILAILFFAFMVPDLWNKTKANTTLPSEQPKKTPALTPEKILISPNLTPSPTIKIKSPEKTVNNTSTPPGDLLIGRVGIPFELNGCEITVKSVSPSNIRTSVWIEAKNTGEVIKQLKLNPKPVIIDNFGNQYESMIVARSGGIVQSDLYPGAKREGAVFFDRLKEGTKLEKMILFVNGDKFEFELGDENKS